MDVADPASVAAALERGILAYGGLDIVVLSAGYATAQPLEELPLEEWQRTYDILTTGSFLVAREAIRVLRQQRRLDGRPLGGSIVSIASKAGLAAAKEAAAYASAKAALEAYLQALRLYFAGSRVIVQVYALGYVDTAMTYGQRLLLPSVAPRAVCPAGGPGPAPGRGAGLFSPVLGAAHPPAALAPVVGLQAPAVLSLLPSTEPGKGPAPQGPAAACDSAAGTSSTASASVKEHGAPPSGSRPIRSIVS